LRAKMDLAARVMLGAYNLLGTAAWLGVSPAVKAGLVGAGWKWSERMGRYPLLEARCGPRVWVHAASVGEARSAAVLASALFERIPDLRLVVSCVTPTGLVAARRAIPAAEAVVQAPVDLSRAVRRALSWFDPSLFVIVETEIWPNVVLECSRRGTPVVVASARISRKSYKRYRYVRPLVRCVLSAVECLAAQTETDLERYRALGLDPSRGRVTGDLKLDAPPEDRGGSGSGGDSEPGWLAAARSGRFFFVAGSTRPGEEEIVGRALAEAKRVLRRGLFCVLAPRHVGRAPGVVDVLSRLGLRAVLASSLERDASGGQDAGEVDVVVLDAMGLLARLYGLSDVAFVGGTLAPLGGHNLAEPASCGVPVLFGPSVETVLPVAERLESHGGGFKVGDASSLASRLEALAADERERARAGRAARQAVESLRGSARRTLDFFEEAGVLPLRG